jgi:hypothetical protein
MGQRINRGMQLFSVSISLLTLFTGFAELPGDRPGAGSARMWQDHTVVRTGEPRGFTAPSRTVGVRIGTHPRIFEGRLSLTLLEAFTDDSLRAVVVLTLDDAERSRIAKQLSPLSGAGVAGSIELPATIGHEELKVRWHRGTSCPDVEIDLPPLTLNASGVTLTTVPSRFRIEIPLVAIDSLPQLLCSWTRQINARRPRVGVVMAINRLLLPESR